MTVSKASGLVILYLGLSTAKIFPIFHEKFEDCVEPGERAGVFDYSDLQILAESDSDVFVNGTIHFLKEITSPWLSIVYTEKFDRDQWNIQGMYKKYPDMCNNIQSPLEPFYFLSSKFSHKNCPFPPGLDVKYDMQPLNEFPTVFTRAFIGKWRLTFYGEFSAQDGKKECLRTYFDVYEE